jgi:bacillithiol system protein YtxJ
LCGNGLVLAGGKMTILASYMNWKPLTDEKQLSEIKERSKQQPQVIFKHSTRCSISSVAKSRLEKGTTPAHIDFHYLDLLSFRSLSAAISEQFGVYHESPQVLLISNGECVYDESHMGINMRDIVDEAEKFMV